MGHEQQKPSLVDKAKFMISLLLEPNIKLPIYATATLMTTIFIIYQINLVIDTLKKIMSTEDQVKEIIAPLPTFFLAIFFFFVVITIANFERDLSVMKRLIATQRKLEEIINQTREDLDVSWHAEAASLAVLAAGISAQKYKDLFPQTDILELEQFLLALSSDCAQHFILDNQQEREVTEDRISQLEEKIFQQSQAFWQKMQNYYQCQTTEKLTRQLIEVFRQNDPFLLEKLVLVAKQTLPNGESVRTSHDKPHAMSLTTHEPQTVMSILDKLSEALDKKIDAGKVLFLSEIPDCFVSSLLAEKMRLGGKDQLTIETTALAAPISKGTDAITNTNIKLDQKIIDALKENKYQSLIFVTNYPEEATRLQSIIYDLLGLGSQVQIFIFSVNGSKMVSDALPGNYLQVIKNNTQVKTADTEEVASGQFSGAVVFQVDTQAVSSSQLFVDHLIKKAANVHPDTSWMLSARKTMMRSEELVYENGQWQVIGDDGHALRTSYLLAFSFITVSEIKKVIDEKGLQTDWYTFLLGALQQDDSSLDKHQPPWENHKLWTKENILAILKEYQT